ncbi:MAG: protein kinase [Candidatus Latescibacterota bacterium]|nr:MAG: protein kinase [Candidatus Latescibacterota bacterium]
MDKRQIAGLEIRDVLGEGGMGTVYRAEDPTLERAVALKVIRAQSMSTQAKERFLREARACSRINHPNIVTVYAAGEEDGRPYLAMEFVEGRTLKDIIDEGSIAWDQAVRWMIDILDALGRLHQDGIIHRDLKPENIMVTHEGVIKLMDFGIARITTSETLTQEGATVGTVFYMSPEQVAGKKIGPQSDVFSIGVVLYQMLTARYPFEGEHPMAVMYSITNTAPQPIEDIVQDIPLELQSILSQALEKDPTRRYANAREFADALRDLIGEQAPAAPSRGLPLRILIPAVAVIAVAVFAAVFFTRGPSHNRELAKNSNEMGFTYQENGDLAAAQIEYRKAIAADPTYAYPWNNLGMMAMLAGDLAEADSLFRQAIKHDPDYAAAHCNLGNVRWERGDLDGAEESFRSGIAADSSIVGGYNDLGVLLVEQKRFDEAAVVIDRGLAVAPNESYLLKNRGRVALGLGDGDEAAAFWQRAVEIDPRNTDAHRLLAEWFESNGQPDRAKPHWTAVLQSGREEDRRAATEALKRLGSD